MNSQPQDFDECPASGQSCSYVDNYGPNGERGCQYCGSAPIAPVQPPRRSPEEVAENNRKAQAATIAFYEHEFRQLIAAAGMAGMNVEIARQSYPPLKQGNTVAVVTVWPRLPSR
jgi:hypothetical protein